MNKESRLILALERYNKSMENVTDVVYSFIDGDVDKARVSKIITEHKIFLKSMETLLKAY